MFVHDYDWIIETPLGCKQSQPAQYPALLVATKTAKLGFRDTQCILHICASWSGRAELVDFVMFVLACQHLTIEPGVLLSPIHATHLGIPTILGRMQAAQGQTNGVALLCLEYVFFKKKTSGFQQCLVLTARTMPSGHGFTKAEQLKCFRF